MAEIDRAGVVGSGLMGSGIAEVLARAGISVLVSEVDEQALDAGRERITKSFARAVSSGKLSKATHDEALARLSYTTNLEDLADRQLVVEAVAEVEQLKKTIFSTLDSVLISSEAIIASNTSSIPIIRLAMATEHPERVLGLHFFNPAPVMPLVELIPSLRTSPITMHRAEILVSATLGKTIVHCKDQAGFVVNALLVPYLLNAIRMLESGTASASDIDDAMQAGCAHPMGPLRLSDFIGLDTLLSIADVLYKEYRDAQYAAPPLLRRMVEAEWLGRKTRRGFHIYEPA
jgi:3-hydroxybutyryl-CoA dehydrogenase